MNVNDRPALRATSTVRLWCRDGHAKLIRETARLSAAEVASCVPTSAATVSRWERGERAPSGKLAVRYYDVLRQIEDVLVQSGALS